VEFPVAYQIMAVTLMVMGDSKNLLVFNFAIILKSRKFDACEICMFYSTCCLGHNILMDIFVAAVNCRNCYRCSRQSYTEYTGRTIRVSLVTEKKNA